MFVASAGAQEGQDTNRDGVADDFDFNGFADDLDGDCIPDDFNGDGIPDGDSTNFVCPEGRGGTLPAELSLQEVAIVLDYLYQRFPDVTAVGEAPDGFPNIPRKLDPLTGEDLGPNFSSLGLLIGNPGARDLLQLPEDQLNQVLLEAEDINNVAFKNPVTGETFFVSTPDALAYTLGQIARAGDDQGLIAGSGSALNGPCMSQAWSYDADGQPLDVAFDWNREDPPYTYSDGPGAPLVQAFTPPDPRVSLRHRVRTRSHAHRRRPGSRCSRYMAAIHRVHRRHRRRHTVVDVRAGQRPQGVWFNPAARDFGLTDNDNSSHTRTRRSSTSRIPSCTASTRNSGRTRTLSRP